MKQVNRKLYWQENIDLFLQSGMTSREFCGRHDLNIKTFYKWKNWLAPTALAKDSCPKTLRLLPVDLKSSIDETSPSLNHSSGIRLEVKGLNVSLDCGFDAATLKRLLSMLEGDELC